MRGEPQSGFASAIVRTSSANSELTGGQPIARGVTSRSRKREALPVPANHGLGANDMERFAPPRPLVGEPHPEETLEAPELRSLRLAAKQDELLPISKDAFVGADVEIERAEVEAQVGETDAAIEHIRHLLSVPCLLSPALLRIDPRWAPLRDDPRFRKLAEFDRD